METITAFFGAALAGTVFVPINPVLRPPQVHHILTDCNVRVLVTSRERLLSLGSLVERCPDLIYVVLIDAQEDDPWPATSSAAPPVLSWSAIGRESCRERVCLSV